TSISWRAHGADEPSGAITATRWPRLPRARAALATVSSTPPPRPVPRGPTGVEMSSTRQDATRALWPSARPAGKQAGRGAGAAGLTGRGGRAGTAGRARAAAAAGAVWGRGDEGRPTMKLATGAGYWSAGPPPGALDTLLEAERLGYDSFWTAEAYGSDALTA